MTRGRTPRIGLVIAAALLAVSRPAAVHLLPGQAGAVDQEHPSVHTELSAVSLQPLALHVRRLLMALDYLGQPLSEAEVSDLNEAIALADERQATTRIQQILDPHVLVGVEINPESRVKAQQGMAPPALVEAGTRLFLVKVLNAAGVTAPLRVHSPQSGKVFISAWAGGNPAEPPAELTARDVAERWADISLYDKPPLAPRLSGSAVEYRILEVYSRDRGERAAELSFDVGQGSQDIGFRSDVAIVFRAAPAQPVTFQVRDEHSRPAVASFVIRDSQSRVYPNPSKRLAPDFPFQPQIYRGDGEQLLLPAGRYQVRWSGGPEYLPRTSELVVEDGRAAELPVRLTRWIDPAARGWFSGDHHVHAAGCSHYQNPTQGVGPEAMIRQLRGEALNVGSVLTWGPCYYHQKQFFSGADHPLSTPDSLLHYDLEISGFPSSHAGHLVLLGLTDQDYPSTPRLEDWPSWTLPILRWARTQGAVTGFAHTGWGLEVKSRELPTDEVPGFDGIGANEFIVTVTHPDTVDFISAIDTPYPWELNIWYHVLNVGFRTRLAGETDFPCITDDRVGLGRTYTRLEGGLTYRGWLEALRHGRSYVSDGRSHLMEFAVNGQPVGVGGSELNVARGAVLRVEVDATALLDEVPDRSVSTRPLDEKPYWDIERARIGGTRSVPVELVINGRAVARQEIVADGQPRPVRFEVAVERSSWVAVRILPSSHSNPIFVTVDGRPIRASRRSARWCLAAVDQCWTQKAPAIRDSEREAARQAYDHARAVYRRLLAESEVD